MKKVLPFLFAIVGIVFSMNAQTPIDIAAARLQDTGTVVTIQAL